jgi:hypothetical protein
VAFARSAAVFFGFFTSRFDLFCPFAIWISNDARLAIAASQPTRFAICTATDVEGSMMS